MFSDMQPRVQRVKNAMQSENRFGAVPQIMTSTQPDAAPPQGPQPQDDPGPFSQLLITAGPQLAMELIDRLLADLRMTQAKLRWAVEAGDTTDMRCQLHIVAALSGTVGAHRLYHTAQAHYQDLPQSPQDALITGPDAIIPQIAHLIEQVAARQTAMAAAHPLEK